MKLRRRIHIQKVRARREGSDRSNINGGTENTSVMAFADVIRVQSKAQGFDNIIDKNVTMKDALKEIRNDANLMTLGFVAPLALEMLKGKGSVFSIYPRTGRITIK